MTFLAISTVILALVWAGLVLLVRRNLRQRQRARDLRAQFIALADELVGRPGFPDAHAQQLVRMASLPQGWLTRFMVVVLLKQMLFGRGVSSRRGLPKIGQVPKALREKYVVAMLSFVLSDSYRCAILGRVVRGTYSWIGEALNEVAPDVNAHATRKVVEQISSVKAPRGAQSESWNGGFRLTRA